MVTRATVGRVTRALKAARVVLIVAGVWIVATWPGARNTGPEAPVADPPQPAPDVDPPARHERDWYAPLWRRDLKQPPIPAAPVDAWPPAPPGPVPTLLATYVDGHGRRAHLVGGDGRTAMMALHEMIDRYELVAIEPGRVELARGDRRVWIDIAVEPRP